MKDERGEEGMRFFESFIPDYCTSESRVFLFLFFLKLKKVIDTP